MKSRKSAVMPYFSRSSALGWSASATPVVAAPPMAAGSCGAGQGQSTAKGWQSHRRATEGTRQHGDGTASAADTCECCGSPSRWQLPLVSVHETEHREPDGARSLHDLAATGRDTAGGGPHSPAGLRVCPASEGQPAGSARPRNSPQPPCPNASRALLRPRCTRTPGPAYAGHRCIGCVRGFVIVLAPHETQTCARGR